MGFLQPKKDLAYYGYTARDQGGYSWLASDGGWALVSVVEDWSADGLAQRKGWRRWQRQYHVVYLATEAGKRYLIKTYPPKSQPGGWRQSGSRAMREFRNTVRAHRYGVRTALPLAVGSARDDERRGVIVYPFLEGALSLGKAYDPASPRPFPLRVLWRLERDMGRVVRELVEKGMCPRDLVPDHFLARREEGRFVLYCVDLERLVVRKWFRFHVGVRALGRLFAYLEWLRRSGWRIHRSDMMRVGWGYFQRDLDGRSKRKRLERRVIGEAIQVWKRRKLSERKPRRASHMEDPVAEPLIPA